MKEVLPQDIVSGDEYFVEYWGRPVRDDPDTPHQLLRKYYGRIFKENGWLHLRDSMEIKDGNKRIMSNFPYMYSLREPTTIEEEETRRQKINYYFKFFPRKAYIIMLRSFLRQKGPLDPDTTEGLFNGWFGGRKRKTNRKKSKKNHRKKTKRR